MPLIGFQTPLKQFTSISMASDLVAAYSWRLGKTARMPPGQFSHPRMASTGLKYSTPVLPSMASPMPTVNMSQLEKTGRSSPRWMAATGRPETVEQAIACPGSLLAVKANFYWLVREEPSSKAGQLHDSALLLCARTES